MSEGAKTVREWLSELEEPQRSKALDNMGKYCTKSGDMLAPTLYTALAGAFVWSQAPEGHEYWSGFCCSLSKKKANAV